MNKKNSLVLGMGLGILIFFFGIGIYFIFGPSSADNLFPVQISAVFKLTGMCLICTSLLVGGFFIENIDRATKILMLIFGILLLLLNIFFMSSSNFY